MNCICYDLDDTRTLVPWLHNTLRYQHYLESSIRYCASSPPTILQFSPSHNSCNDLISLLPTIIPVSNPQLQASGRTAPCKLLGGGIPSSRLMPAASLLHNRSRTIHSTPCNWWKCLHISMYSVPELKPNPQRNKQRTQLLKLAT